MKNKIIAFIIGMSIFSSILFTGYNVSAQSAVSFSFDKSNVNVNNGDSFTLKISGTNLENLYAYEVVVVYDQQKVTFKNSQALLTGNSYNVNKIIENTLYHAYTKVGDEQTANGNLELCSLTFEGKNSGEAQILLEEVNIVEKDVNRNLKKITYPVGKIVAAAISGGASTPTPTPTPAPTTAPTTAPTSTPKPISTPKPTTTPVVIPGKVERIVLETVVDNAQKKVIASVPRDIIEEAFERAEPDSRGASYVIFQIEQEENAEKYTLEVPGDILSATGMNRNIVLDTPLATMVIPSNMFTGKSIKESDNVQISISEVNKDSLDERVKEKIGDRPILEFNVMSDGKKLSWNNPKAPITVYIDYTPSEEEMLDPEHIIIWYIDSKGKITCIPNGRYIVETGKVVFRVTHFSKYAVAFEKKTFKDIESYPWAKKEVEVLASKGITNGTSDVTYSPERNITRADFLTLLIRTLELRADFTTNFDDVNTGTYYYESIGIAKELGIILGVGNNKFNPNREISRQDMMVMTYNALKAAGRIDGFATEAAIEDFDDMSQVAQYAVGSVATLVDLGLIKGSGNRIKPRDNTTRAEVAVILYRILNYN